MDSFDGERKRIAQLYDEAYPNRANKKGRGKKLRGALTAEAFRRCLAGENIPVSPRDVFIRGLPVELDLIVPKVGAPPPDHNVLYGAQDVAAVLEVKFNGVFDRKANDAIRSVFTQVRNLCGDVECIYVTVTESKSYKHAIVGECERFQFPAYTLFWTSGGGIYEENSGAWVQFVSR
jgi:hypothetical protein